MLTSILYSCAAVHDRDTQSIGRLAETRSCEV